MPSARCSCLGERKASVTAAGVTVTYPLASITHKFSRDPATPCDEDVAKLQARVQQLVALRLGARPAERCCWASENDSAARALPWHASSMQTKGNGRLGAGAKGPQTT